MALGSLKSVAGDRVVEKWIGARVLDLGHYSWLFCKEHNCIHCDNGALHATPVLQFSSYTTQPINFRAQKHKLSPESSPVQSPAFA